jgi:hypothetical protein
LRRHCGLLAGGSPWPLSAKVVANANMVWLQAHLEAHRNTTVPLACCGHVCCVIVEFKAEKLNVPHAFTASKWS